MHQVEKLKIWTSSMELVLEVYKLLKSVSDTEKYGLISQMKRSAVSIPSNIAEGAGRNNNREFYHFMEIASGSLYELQTQLILLSKLGFCTEEEIAIINSRIIEIQKMVYVFKQKLIENQQHQKSKDKGQKSDV